MKKFRDYYDRIPFGFLSKKTIRAMKLTFFISILAVFQLFATETYSQMTKLTLKLEEVKISDALREIENQSEFFFLYSPKLIDVERKVNIDSENETISDILSDIFGGNVKFAAYDRQVILTPIDQSGIFSELQQRIIAGTVTDKDGVPLPGVNVIVTGLTLGTITDNAGKYSIDIPQGSKSLTFSFIGMVTQEISIGTLTQINITLVESSIGLDEVVVIGYGTAKKSEVTGAVGSITGEKLRIQTSFNPLAALRGKVSGVEIFSNSGSSFGRPRVVIRGIGTINASASPLYVVDGVQTSNIEYLNTNDIQNIEVLKDASSAAIYGARGANGVILISTKSGKVTEGVTVEFSTKLMGDRIYKKHNSDYDAMNSEEFMTVQKMGFENAPVFKTYAPGTAPVLVLNSANLFDSQGKPLYDTDWEKESTRFAISYDQQLNVQVRGAKTSSGIFVNYTDRQEIFLNSYAKRANVRFFHEVNPTNWLSVSANISLSEVWSQNQLELGWSMNRLILEMPPIFPVQWPDGTYSDAGQTAGTNMSFETLANPVAALKFYERPVDRLMLFGNLKLGLHITPDLTFTSLFGIDNSLQVSKTFAPKWLRYAGGYPLGVASIANSKGDYWQSENYLTYKKDLGIHRLGVMLGVSWQQQISSNSSLGVSNYPDDFYSYYYINAASTYSKPSSNYFDWTMQSVFARANYTYNNKYSFTFTGRADGSSRFGENNKYSFFPSGGFSWLISDEDFMAGIKFLDRLRLRTSYGITGNTEIGLYGSLASITAGTTLMGNQLVPTSYASRLANRNLAWEKTSQFDVGFELDVFNSAITLEADYYNKFTHDLLLNRPIPETTGFNTIADNIGSVSNKGIEIMIIGRPIKRHSFDWTSTLTFSRNKNKIEKLGLNNEDIFPGSPLGGPLVILRVGEELNTFWGSVRTGTYGTGEEEAAKAAGTVVGEKKYANNSEKQIIGHGLPKFRGSWINTINIGKFDLVIDLQYNYGNDMYQVVKITAEDRTSLMNGMKTELYRGWTPENQSTMVARVRNHNLSGSVRTADSHYITDGSYLRGNLFSIGYTLAQDLLRKAGIKSLKIVASAQNAFVLYSRDFVGYDPESAGAYNVQETNVDQNIMFQVNPKSTTFTLGLDVQF